MNTSFIRPAVLRSRAEKQLAARQAWVVPDSEVDQLKLIHELQVHQIELEMQNEMLSEAFSHVNSLRAKYQDLYEFAPVGYFTLSTEGKILELNGRAALLLGQGPRALVGRMLREFFSDTSVAVADNLLTAAANGREEVFALSLQIRRPQQMSLRVNAQARAWVDPFTAAPGIRLVMTDVSALKLAAGDDLRPVGKVSGWGSL